ncbi:MAG: murein biosynthesis integral membrane protein MurJ [Acidimicrobiales bacterium]|nr:murein biosynthesis integral membrane protein MurJ [Acidimicrobiales bacterium]
MTEATAASSPRPARRLLRSSAVVSAGTALSRLTGFARLLAMAFALGFTALTDSYNIANNTPTILYELLLGGVLAATLVPVFVEHLERGDDDGPSAVVSVALIALAALTALAFVAAPWLIRLYTAAAADTPGSDAERQLATDLLRWFVFQLPFYGLAALWSALLQARRRFAAQAFAPVVNNLVVIGVLIAVPLLAGGAPQVRDVLGDAGLTALLGAGTTAGIAAMALVLWPALRRAGVRLRWHPAGRDPAVRRVVRLAGWTVGYVIANQVSLLVVTALALQTDGGVSAYQGAFLVLQLPYALLGLAITTTFTPELATAASQHDEATFRQRLDLGRRLTAIVMLPAAAGLAVLARPLVSALLDHGAFSDASAELTGDTLALFALSLPGMAAYLFMLRGFFARQDTKTPFLLNVLENAVNVALALVLYPWIGVPGLALAWTVAYVVAPVVTHAVLARRLGGLGDGRVPPELGRPLAATLVMAAAVWGVTRVVGADTGLGSVARTAVGVLVGLAVYAAMLVVLREPAVHELRGRLGSRGRHPVPGA